jgi:hypothetical protein
MSEEGGTKRTNTVFSVDLWWCEEDDDDMVSDVAASDGMQQRMIFQEKL